MRMSPRTIRLAGEDLHDHRHVCALVDGLAGADELLLPFIIDGLAEGDRVVHILDPELRDAHLSHLRESGIDVDAAMASNQLDVRPWTDAYLRGGRFDRSAQLAYVRETLAEGPRLGFPLTRLIGSTEWAIESESMPELLSYEARLDVLLRNVPDFVICTYDMHRHSAQTIAEVLGIHPVSIVGGVVRASRSQVPEPARERILGAASRLFHDVGILATGVDSLIEAAGVAKATFYRHFPSKDDLVVAWLRDPRTRWLDRVAAQAEAHGAAGQKLIPLFFEALAEWLETEGYRGCPYLNTSVEITDPTHPARLVVREYLQEIEDYLTELVRRAGYRDSRMLAVQLQALVAGSISLAVARRSGAFALTAREAAISLLRNAERI